MKIDNIIEYINSLFSNYSEDIMNEESGFYNPGINEVNKIGYTTNLTPDVVEQARMNNVDLIVTHHDAWDFIFGIKEECINKMDEYKIAHYFVHAPLDGCSFGTNVSLANKLGLNILKETHFEDGVMNGRICEYETPKRMDEIVKDIEKLLDEPVKSWQFNNRLIKKVGIVTGAGFRTTDLLEAYNEQCDLYITGEKILYTVEYAKLKKMNLIVGSHTFTEIFGVESLVNNVKEKFPSINITVINEEHIE